MIVECTAALLDYFTLGEHYEVLEDSDMEYRLRDDDGDSCWMSKSSFKEPEAKKIYGSKPGWY